MEHELSQTQSPFATEPIGRLIVKFAVPSVIALLVNSLYNIVDQIFIGNGVGYLGNGATNIVFPITIIALALAMMIGNGGAAYLSLKLGEGNVNSAKKGIGNAVTMVTAVSIVLAAVFLLFINPILTLFGATDTLRPYALDYGWIIGIGLPFMMISGAINSMIRADGSPKYAMFSMVIGAVLNVILDAVFIFPLQMGVQGAAIATVIGQVASFVVSVAYLPRFKTVRLNKSAFCLDTKACGNIVVFGLSSFITQFAITIVMALTNNLLAQYRLQLWRQKLPPGKKSSGNFPNCLGNHLRPGIFAVPVCPYVRYLSVWFRRRPVQRIRCQGFPNLPDALPSDGFSDCHCRLPSGCRQAGHVRASLWPVKSSFLSRRHCCCL